MKRLCPFIDLGIIKLSVFPIILVLAIFSCILTYMFSDKYDNFYFSQIRASSIYCMIGAGIVGKLLYVFTTMPIFGLSVFERLGGFVFFGGLIGAVLGLYIYSIRKWNRFLDLLDTYVSIIPLGQAIGRIGCFFNGCCYGKTYNGFFSVRYIVNYIETFVFPTWFIESGFCFLLFICMFCISKQLFAGMYSAIYMMSYSLFRFIIEFFRGDSLRGVWCGLSTSQYISIGIFFIGVVILIKSNLIKEKNLLIIRRRKNGNRCISRCV